MNCRALPLTLLIIIIAGFSDLRAQVTIDTRGGPSIQEPAEVKILQSGWAGFVAAVGEGQTFAAPAGTNYLNNFSFWLAGCGTMAKPSWADAGLYCTDDFQFKAFLFRWDEGTKKAIGPALYESDARVANHTDVREYRYNAGGVSVNPGDTYVAVISSATRVVFEGRYDCCNYKNPQRGGAALRTTTLSNNIRVGGGYVEAWTYNRAGLYSTSPAVLTQSSDVIANYTEWRTSYSPDNWEMSMAAEFTADFSEIDTTATPEPASMCLLASGVAALGAFRKRRQQKRSTENT